MQWNRIMGIMLILSTPLAFSETLESAPTPSEVQPELSVSESDYSQEIPRGGKKTPGKPSKKLPKKQKQKLKEEETVPAPALF